MLDFITRQDMPAVLLIDDDMVSREVMATVLTMSGYPVDTAADGDRAVALLQEKSCAPELILMDAQMPGLSGVELIRQLRRHSGARLFVISASDAPADVLAEADGFLQKPFAPEALTTLLESKMVREGPKAAPGLDPHEAIVNRETLAQLREMMPDAAVKQIYEAIIADLGRRIAGLEAAIASGDWPETRRLGHAIKGGGLMAGAVQVARLGEKVESGALEPQRGRERTKVTIPVNQSDNSSSILADLRTAGVNLQRMLDAEFKA
jgi:two-component system sensor histidine kinase TorS